jgi:hypothetical protein
MISKMATWNIIVKDASHYKRENTSKLGKMNKRYY